MLPRRSSGCARPRNRAIPTRNTIWRRYTRKLAARPTNNEEAALWYRKAADQGNADAQYKLGVMYFEGRGVARDDASAIDWFRKAGEGGSAEAELTLAYMYSYGQGAPKDDAQAVIWYRKAAEQGNAKGESALAAAYEKGRGAPLDLAQAAYWYGKAAERGDADSQYILGEMYAAGQGVAQDYIRAHMFLDLAASGPADSVYHQMASQDRDMIEAKMTPDQIAEAQRLARGWKAK